MDYGENMTNNQQPRAYLFYLAWAGLLLGLVGVVLTLLFGSRPFLEQPLAYLAMALTVGGGGEILNHPKHRPLFGESLEMKTAARPIRERNACALGNLLEIASIILFFIGLGKYFARF
jgi:hypothetical protein